MPDSYASHISAAAAQLARAREQLGREIQDYPTPIAGCDAQFNHLLAERRKVTDALRALDQTVFVPTPRSPTPASGVESR